MPAPSSHGSPHGSESADRNLLRDAIALAQAFTERLLADFPADQARFRPAPTDNHAQWILGHVAVGYDDVAALLDGEPRRLDATHRGLYGWSSKPSDTARDEEPPFDVLVERLARSRDRLREAVDAASDEQLAAPPPDDLAYIGPTHAALAMSCAWHEGWHAGQLASIRRALGRPAAVSQVEQP